MPNDKNLPAKLPGAGLYGPRTPISREERRERRLALERMMASGKGNFAIETEMNNNWGVTPASVKKLMKEIFQAWAKESKDRRPYLKMAAERRIYEEIEDAREDRSHTAVASLEKVLQGTQGTLEEPEKNKNSDQGRLYEALAQIVSNMDPAHFRVLVDRERVLIDSGDGEILLGEKASLAELQSGITVSKVKKEFDMDKEDADV